MPNWCNNVLEISHTDAGMMKRVKESYAKGELLNEFIPVPKDLQITAGYLGDANEQKELERKTAENVKNHGYGNWYDYCVGEWGTKWDVGEAQGIQSHDPNELIVYFDSAWAPPTTAYGKLVDLGFTV